MSPVHSPLDPNATLIDDMLETGLPVLRCPTTGGVWVEHEAYRRWRDARQDVEGDATDDVDTERTVQVDDSRAGKRCPKDGGFLIRYPVGHGLEFHVDRCGRCFGVWLDAGEWEALKAKGLEGDLYEIFSPPWQAEVRRQQREAARARLLEGKLGSEDYAETQRITGWLLAHTHRREILAHLQQAIEQAEG